MNLADFDLNEIPRKTCPSCGEQNCNYDCDGSQFDDYNDDVVERIQFNTICDVFESFVLALGPKLSKSDIQDVLNTVFDALDNNS